MVGNGARKIICQRYTRPKRAAPFGAIDKKAAGTGSDGSTIDVGVAFVVGVAMTCVLRLDEQTASQNC